MLRALLIAYLFIQAGETMPTKYDECRKAIFTELNLVPTDKTNKAFELAWEYGHSSGYEEIKNYMLDLKELICQA